jgi:hypothetical protein
MQPPAGGTARIQPLAIAFLLLSGSLSFAGSAAADWQPPPPMPDDFDWVQLVSGEWLKGEIRVMYQDVLEFDSEELDLLSLDLEDIEVIRSAQIINLRVSTGQESAAVSGPFGGRIAQGKLLLEGNTATVIGNEQTSFARSDIVSIAAGVLSERNYWSGHVSIGSNFRSGNTDQTEATTSVSFQRRTVVSRLAFDHLGNYSETNGLETANNQRGNIKWDRFRNERLFVTPLFAEYFSDTFQNIALRYTMGTAVGYQLRDTAKTDWNVSIGPAFQQTKYKEVEPGTGQDDGSWALSAEMAFATDLTSRIEFDYGYRFQLTSEQAGKYNHHMISTLSFEMTDSLDIDLALIWDRIKEPRPDSDGIIPVPDDYRMTIGIGYDF